jgi:hypothetical protein
VDLKPSLTAWVHRSSARDAPHCRCTQRAVHGPKSIHLWEIDRCVGPNRTLNPAMIFQAPDRIGSIKFLEIDPISLNAASERRIRKPSDSTKPRARETNPSWERDMKEMHHLRGGSAVIAKCGGGERRSRRGQEGERSRLKSRILSRVIFKGPIENCTCLNRRYPIISAIFYLFLCRPHTVVRIFS